MTLKVTARDFLIQKPLDLSHNELLLGGPYLPAGMIKYFENWCQYSHSDVFDYSDHGQASSVEHDSEHPNKRLSIPDDPSFLTETQIAQLEKVRSLKLDKNQLLQVPSWLSTVFKNLTVLSLQENRLTAVPTLVSSLRLLNELDLSFNGIQVCTGLC
jgi:Leucine-rich repeat (LRR) protein